MTTPGGTAYKDGYERLKDHDHLVISEISTGLLSATPTTVSRYSGKWRVRAVSPPLTSGEGCYEQPTTFQRDHPSPPSSLRQPTAPRDSTMTACYSS